MHASTYFLVLASTVTHAYWNFLVKRNHGGVVFVGLSKVAEAILFAPVFLVLAPSEGRGLLAAWPIICIGAALTLTNYVALSFAYRTGDLSIAYPISRGSTLLFLPALGFFSFHERLSPLGWLGLSAILSGILALRFVDSQTSSIAEIGQLFRNVSSGCAVLAGLAAAAYTVWDKHAIQSLSAFGYFYAYTVLVGAAYASYLFLRQRNTVATVWRDAWWPIVQVGVFNTVTYLIVLLALRNGVSSYVIGLRQLSIAVGVFLGWRLLGEDFGRAKRIGVSLLLTGCMLLAFAR